MPVEGMLAYLPMGSMKERFDGLMLDVRYRRDQFDRDYLEFEVNVNDLEATLQVNRDCRAELSRHCEVLGQHIPRKCLRMTSPRSKEIN